MKITHLGHACLLVETAGARILIDPGTLSSGFEGLRDLDAILISHNHEDHLDVPKVVELITANPNAVVLADPESAPSINARAVKRGDRIEVGGSVIDVLGETHAPIYENFPGSANVAFVIDDGALFHPGDSFDVPDVKVDVLALPISGPWLKLGDVIEYLRTVSPRVAIPIHEAAWADLGMPHSMLGHFTPDGTSLTILERGVATEL